MEAGKATDSTAVEVVNNSLRRKFVAVVGHRAYAAHRSRNFEQPHIVETEPIGLAYSIFLELYRQVAVEANHRNEIIGVIVRRLRKHGVSLGHRVGGIEPVSGMPFTHQRHHRFHHVVGNEFRQKFLRAVGVALPCIGLRAVAVIALEIYQIIPRSKIADCLRYAESGVEHLGHMLVDRDVALPAMSIGRNGKMPVVSTLRACSVAEFRSS